MLFKIQKGGLMEILILIMIIAFFGIIVVPFVLEILYVLEEVD